jgi:hypothetical protein
VLIFYNFIQVCTVLEEEEEKEEEEKEEEPV